MRAHLLLLGFVGALLCCGPAALAGPAQDRGEDKDDAALRVRYFPDHELGNCRLERLFTGRVLEFCALSAPAGPGPGPGQRRFSLTLRDPTKMEKGLREAVLVAATVVKAEKGEYLDYRRASAQRLRNGLHLLFAPLVKGVPERPAGLRALLYVFSESDKKILPYWESPPCSAGCRGQELRVVPPEGEGPLAIEYVQVQADGSSKAYRLLMRE